MTRKKSREKRAPFRCGTAFSLVETELAYVRVRGKAGHTARVDREETMFRKTGLAAIAILMAAGSAWADPIEGTWKRPNGTLITYAGSGSKFCGTVMTGEYKGKSIGCMTGSDGDLQRHGQQARRGQDLLRQGKRIRQHASTVRLRAWRTDLQEREPRPPISGILNKGSCRFRRQLPAMAFRPGPSARTGLFEPPCRRPDCGGAPARFQPPSARQAWPRSPRTIASGWGNR